MTSPAQRSLAAFRAAFGVEPTLQVRAPGRVNLIGEHTDYNDGFVLPCALQYEAVVTATPADDGHITVVAADFDQRDRFALNAISHAGAWRDYVRGVATVLGERFPLAGAQLAIAGDVPHGAGLSSSAALEVAVGRVLVELAGRTLSPDELALAAQRAENSFVGCACGIMDQLISARGVAGHALLIDCRSLDCRPVALPAGAAILIIDSGVKHSNVGGEYNSRRAQCEAAARHYGVAALRDLDVATLNAGAAGLDDETFRRARHVVTENARTLAAADALAAGDLAVMGRLMRESHASMRDDFAITVPAIDALTDLANAAIGEAGGARMTGGGFGGSVVALVRQAMVDDVTSVIASGYRLPSGEPPVIRVCRAAEGASAIPLD
jgi:galactokinase